MAESSDASVKIKTKRVFKDRSNEQKETLLEGKDKKSTQRATSGALRQFLDYLELKNLPKLHAITDPSQLNAILSDFYTALRPLKDAEDYCVQSLKCIRSGLNRFMRKDKGWDICNDPPFVKSNEMFKAVCVEAKKNGKGCCRSTPTISDIDLERLSEYFCDDHINQPDPKKLQQQLLFYIVYFFCCRGRKNLYEMKANTFDIMVNYNGSQYVYQNVDEMDKNHGIQDTEKTNDGKMYANGRECI